MNVLSGCTSLQTISVPTSMVNKLANATSACVVLNNTITANGFSTFTVRHPVSITFPSQIKIIKSKALRGCGTVVSVTIGNGVTSIGSMSFENSYSLRNLTIPNSVVYIGNH